MNDTITPEQAQQRLEERRKELAIYPPKEPTGVSESIERLRKAWAAIPPEVLAERQKQHEESLARAAEELLGSANCPDRHRHAKGIDRAGKWAEVEADLLGRMGSGFLVALVGTRGCGKTQIGVELIRVRTRGGNRCKYCTAMEFFMDIKAGYGGNGESEKDVIARYCRPKLLVIDELGKRAETEWENRLLYELLNRRYNAVLDTLIISNQEAKELNAALGPSIVSRMQETGGIKKCDWPSYRNPAGRGGWLEKA